MEKEQVKRNYNYIIYNILREKTSEKDKHLSAPEICREIAAKYGVKEPNRKTVYQFEKDFKTFGYDIQKDKKGYYLGKRELTEGELQLLIDGIESLNGISIDNKIDIYEKLCKIIGRDYRDINNFIYSFKFDLTQEDDKDMFPDDECKKNLETVYNAIKDKKKINIIELLLPFSNYIMDELTDDEMEYFRQLQDDCTMTFTVNPYQIFRSKDNSPVLLFYIKVKDKVHIGAYPIIGFANSIYPVDEKKDKVDTFALFGNLDLSDFDSAKYYKEGQSIKKAEIRINSDAYYVPDVTDLWKITNTITLNGEKVIMIEYKAKKEKEIIDLCIDFYDVFIVMKGSDLYEALKEIQENLTMTYGK